MNDAPYIYPFLTTGKFTKNSYTNPLAYISKTYVKS